jgi:biofilm PGA synthesis N-glycosyltransferase PgaC
MMLPDFTLRWELSILVVFGLMLVMQLGYYLFTFIKVSIYKLKPHPVSYPPVSVVICARNEEENLKNFLPLVLQQEYPQYEVIVVNDCSWDGSQDLLEALQKDHKHLNIREIKEVEGREHGKKFALTIGIKAARYETLLLTDADCYPTSSDWITHMINGHGEEKEIVLG